MASPTFFIHGTPLAGSSNQKAVQFVAIELLVSLKEELNVTDRVLQTVIKKVDDLYSAVLDFLQEKFHDFGPDESTLTVKDAIKVFDTVKGQSFFGGIKSVKNLENYVHQNEGLVYPEKVVTLKRDVVKGNNIKTVDVRYGYIIPFLPQLEKVLSSPEVLHCVQNPRPVQEGVFSSPLDGAVYQSHPVVKKDPNALAIGLYHDDVLLTDTASAKAKKTSVRFFYWVLLNTYPELRSCMRATNLLCVVKTSVLKTDGYGPFLKDMIAGLNRLSSEAGVTLTIRKVEIVFHGIFLFTCGDNPASASITGMKETHFAEHPCRECLASNTDMFHFFEASKFVVRTRASHQAQLNEVLNHIEEKGVKSPSVTYGINCRSDLMDINHCDVTKAAPQDLMHVVVEGTLVREIICSLKNVITRKKMTLKTINARIQAFSKCFPVSPGPIEEKHLEAKKLHMTAYEILHLAYMLPFVLRKKNMLSGAMESVLEEANLKCYILRLQLLDLYMSKTFTYDDIARMRKLIKKHHSLFCQLYPGEETLKLHCEVHLPNQILLYGPLRQHWCFRFEGKHAFFKRLCRILHTFKNICWSLSIRHQRRECGLRMLSNRGQRGPYLHSTATTGKLFPKQFQTSKYHDVLACIYPDMQPDSEISWTRVVTLKGVKFQKGSVIFLSLGEQGLPVFGEVRSMYNVLNEIVFVYTQLLTTEFETELNSYKVCYPGGVGAVLLSSLTYRHAIPFVKSYGSYHVLLPGKCCTPA